MNARVGRGRGNGRTRPAKPVVHPLWRYSGFPFFAATPLVRPRTPAFAGARAAARPSPGGFSGSPSTLVESKPGFEVPSCGFSHVRARRLRRRRFDAGEGRGRRRSENFAVEMSETVVKGAYLVVACSVVSRLRRVQLRAGGDELRRSSRSAVLGSREVGEVVTATGYGCGYRSRRVRVRGGSGAKDSGDGSATTARRCGGEREAGARRWLRLSRRDVWAGRNSRPRLSLPRFGGSRAI